ncbi:glycosyltransferase family 4 protein [Pseudotamlana agarivorans]|uniref:glycosyltransferase family 4 protein n=1 Tax=Pseudotamlana agarivorans TaxID=481183 RepID=UPI001FDFF1D1|nr:glycosyltransferase [Tamlana agarivorans]
MLIVGPIGDFGGTELEAGFIAKSLSSKYEVSVCSTGNISKNSEIYNCRRKFKVYTLNQLLYKNDVFLRLLAKVSYIKNNRHKDIFSLINNKIAKSYFNYDKKRTDLLNLLIPQYDLVLICAQLSSVMISDIITVSKKNKKPLVFRVTTTVKRHTISNPDIFNKVDLFIFHSQKNSKNFEKYYFEPPYLLIDQCAIKESELLRLPLKNKRIDNFFVLSRLSKEKQINVVINAFKNVSKKEGRLFIFGEGDEKRNLVNLAVNDGNIVLKGYVENSEIVNVFKNCDCLVISSSEEAGPLTALEAMASGTPIISTKVGAMEERLGDDCFWYDGSQEDLENKMKLITSMSESQISNLSEKLRRRYLSNYKISFIEKKYINAVERLI